MAKTKEQVEMDIELGEREEDIYTEEGREVAVDDDTLTDAEEGFMEGYEEEENAAKCATCHMVLDQHFVEKNIDGKHYRFCSEACAETFKVEE